jgi:hypothetical protein
MVHGARRAYSAFTTTERAVPIFINPLEDRIDVVKRDLRRITSQPTPTTGATSTFHESGLDQSGHGLGNEGTRQPSLICKLKS